MIIREVRSEPLPCKMPGCARLTRGVLGYCADHYSVAYPCIVDDCWNRVSAWSRSRCCKDHRKFAGYYL